MTNQPPVVPAAPQRQTRIKMTLTVGVIVIVAAITYRYFRYARPIGSGPAGPMVARELFSNEWSTRHVVVLGLGDSITQGLGASPGCAYFNRLIKNPASEFPEMEGISLSAVLPKIEPINLSIAGTTSIECIDYQLPKLEPFPADTFGIVIMTTGGNDVIHNYGRTPPREGAMFGATVGQIDDWVQNYDRRLDLIVKKLRETFPGGCHIFIGNIYDPTDGDGDIVNAGLPTWPDGLKVLKAYNESIAKFAERHADVTLIDIRSAFLGHGIHCTHFWHRHYQSKCPTYWYWDNLEDPNDQGYDAIRRLFLIEIAKNIPEKLNVER